MTTPSNPIRHGEEMTTLKPMPDGKCCGIPFDCPYDCKPECDRAPSPGVDALTDEQAAISEALNDLEARIKAEYDPALGYPVIERRRKRDMDVVIKGRTALQSITKPMDALTDSDLKQALERYGHVLANKYRPDHVEFVNGILFQALIKAALQSITKARDVPDGWMPGNTAPMDGETFQAGYVGQMPMRYKLYKPASNEYKAGKKGRWQQMSEYGGWDNTDQAPEFWKPARISAASPREQKG